MPRRNLTEIHDHPGFPTRLRDLVTEALEALWSFGNSYKPILPRLTAALTATRTSTILDLCSGGGGPWPRLTRELHATRQPPLHIRLTDRYPNLEAFRRASTPPPAPTSAHESAALSNITYANQPIDATKVPSELDGFRTIFSAFHHFDPAAATRILENAVIHQQGIAVFEVARPALRTLLVITTLPFVCLMLAPGLRPFRWTRLLFTYLIPVVPVVICYDGIISCFRAYSHAELTQLVSMLPPSTYQWHIGEETTGLLPVTYLIGHPNTQSSDFASVAPHATEPGILPREFTLTSNEKRRAETPLSLLKTEAGGRAVETLLAALEYGFPV